MRELRIAAVQFEHRDADKDYNLGRIRELALQAVANGAEVVSFHECSISAYSFAQSLTFDQLLDVAEDLDNSPSLAQLQAISREAGVPVLAGLFERVQTADGWKIYNTYVCVDGRNVLARFRKLHAFVSPHLSSGSEFCVFDLLGWKCGILICYDNNLPENVRATTLQGAQIIFMPHVTGCLPSVMPGRGIVDPQLWHHRETDPVPLRQEFAGPKSRGWLMRFLPARAWENGVYAVFTNPIGMDFGEVRPGNAMILDPFGEVLTECQTLGDDFCIGVCDPAKLELSSGRRYLRARRPELYTDLVAPSDLPPLTEPGWSRKPGSSE